MGFQCIRSLYWYEEPDHSGSLADEPTRGSKPGRLAMRVGKRYKIVPRLHIKEGLEHIILAVVGESNREYSISQKQILTCFKIPKIKK